MALSPLQDYCLSIMGITQWQFRSEAAEYKPFLLLLNESLTEEKTQLLLRLIQALKWQRELTHIEVLTTWRKEHIDTLIEKYQVRKMVLFNEPLANQFDFTQVEVVAIPNVAEMLTNVEAKKRAWQLLQKLIGG